MYKRPVKVDDGVPSVNKLSSGTHKGCSSYDDRGGGREIIQTEKA
jgi:hypothetical protein